MARYNLDELEADEIYHAVVERKTLLEKRAKDLEEKDGLPEAAESVRGRISLYNPNGEGKNSRPGLIRLFAPQRDIEAETQASRADEERDPEGQQDVFGGGAETGGGHPPGEKGTTKKRGGKRKGATGTEATGAAKPAEGSPADASQIADGEATDVEVQIIPEGRRLGSGPADVNDPVERALSVLEADAKSLLSGAATIDPATFDIYAELVLAQLPIANPRIDADYLANQVTGEFRDAEDNARALGYFLMRTVEKIRDDRDKPIGGKERDGLKDFNTLSDVSDVGTDSPPHTDPEALNFAPPAPDPQGNHRTGEQSDTSVSS